MVRRGPAIELVPQIRVREDLDVETGMGIEVTVDNHNRGLVEIDWGDGSAPDTNPGDGRVVSAHVYKQAGKIALRATDRDRPSTHTTATKTVTVPMSPGPHIVVQADPQDPTGMTVMAVVDNHHRGSVSLIWDLDHYGPDIFGDNPGDGETVSHTTYSTPGTKTIIAVDATAPGTIPVGTATITVPAHPTVPASDHT